MILLASNSRMNSVQLSSLHITSHNFNSTYLSQWFWWWCSNSCCDIFLFLLSKTGGIYFVSPREWPWRQRMVQNNTLVIARVTSVFSHAFKNESRDWRTNEAFWEDGRSELSDVTGRSRDETKYRMEAPSPLEVNWDQITSHHIVIQPTSASGSDGGSATAAATSSCSSSVRLVA